MGAAAEVLERCDRQASELILVRVGEVGWQLVREAGRQLRQPLDTLVSDA
jgi:hypothetical protein